MRVLVLLLFFLSGAAGLVYEVTWARSLGLVFGASHLAVATVLAVYMGGQALGATIFGRRVDRAERPLRLSREQRITLQVLAVVVAAAGGIMFLGFFISLVGTIGAPLDAIEETGQRMGAAAVRMVLGVLLLGVAVALPVVLFVRARRLPVRGFRAGLWT